MSTTIETIIVGQIETNCYLVTNNGQTLIIDPGAESEKILELIHRNKFKPVAIINTHGHYDHLLASQVLQKTLKIPAYYPAEDKYLIPIQQKLYALQDFEPEYFYTDKIAIPGFAIQVIPTPGHTKGSSCLLIDGKLFSGDMLFAEGYLGRTDLWGGSDTAIQVSLRKLLELPDNIVVYPGHGPITTIGMERGQHG